MKIGKAGGSPTAIVTSVNETGYGVTAIAVDSTSVYWTASMQAWLRRAAVVGGAATTVASGIDANSLVADGQSVFTIVTVRMGNPPLAVKVAVSSGLRTDLDLSLMDAGYLGNPNANLVADSEYLYWPYRSSQGLSVVKLSKGGGAPMHVPLGIPASGTLARLAVDDTYLYWTQSDGPAPSGSIVRLDK